MESFSKRKQDILSKTDKSSIGKWDEKITVLCDKINSLSNYYTTSSCSGRIILMINQEKKGKDLFVFVSHDKVSFDKLRNEINLALKKMGTSSGFFTTPATQQEVVKKIKFKFEPCILHIACETLEGAEKIYNKAKLAGWKKSGIVGTKNGFTIELNSTERLEFPIIQNKKILVSDEFLKIIVEEANKKLEKVWGKIEKLERLMQ